MNTPPLSQEQLDIKQIRDLIIENLELKNRISQLVYQNTLKDTELGYLRDKVKNRP